MKPVRVGGSLVSLAPIFARDYVLLPLDNHISVLAVRTGHHIATLKTDNRICSVAIHDNAAFAGCSDGTICEFSLAALSQSIESPRRTFRISHDGDSVTLLAAISSDDSFLYAFVVSNRTKKGYIPGKVVRIDVAPFAPGDEIFMCKDAKIQVVDNYRFNDDDENSRPFYMSVVNAPPTSNYSLSGISQCGIFVILASEKTLTLYYDYIGQATSSVSDDSLCRIIKPVSLTDTIPSSNPLSSCTVTPNGTDIACGHVSGIIRILTDVLTSCQKYCLSLQSTEKQKIQHPAKMLLVRSVHWHAHAIPSMAYDFASGNDAMLYSGGDESVLVTWQLARGIYKPSSVLPRIAMGGIRHIAYNNGQSRSEPNSVLVYCSDNSLQLFDAHNKNLVWKIHGLASMGEREVNLLHSSPTMFVDRCRPQYTLIISGLNGAPGHIHWYDPVEQRVVNSLEIAPFNRVSRTDSNDISMPLPTITHTVWSQSGRDMITVDVVATENTSVGSHLSTPLNVFGSVTTIRFWSATTREEQEPHEMTSSMSFPHGAKNRISALAISSDGIHACTVSNDEKTFRLWKQIRGKGSGSKRKATESMGDSFKWICRCKVTIPSGYTNAETGEKAVAFSEDASVLAVAFGGVITLWDQYDITQLTSLTCGDGSAGLKSVSFVRTDRMIDSILTTSRTSVSMQSPYGLGAAACSSWHWHLPVALKNTLKVSCAESLPFSELIVIAIYNEDTDKSRIVVVDAVTGEQNAMTPVTDNINGEVVCLVGVDAQSGAGDWSNTRERPPIIHLHALMSHGEMLLFSNRCIKEPNTFAFDEILPPAVPKLPLLSPEDKLSNHFLNTVKLYEMENNYEDIKESHVPASSLASSEEIPLLRGAFSRNFITRYLKRCQGE